jgi:hypothetical protein
MEYEETNLQTETEQHNQAQKLFRREWEYKAIGDKEQQTMTSIGVRLLQRIVSLGVCVQPLSYGHPTTNLYGNNEQTAWNLIAEIWNTWDTTWNS